MNNSNSLLFVPGSRPERFKKALESGADAVIIDLEDAVAPGDKDSARATLAAWLDPRHPVLVRINAADTPWFGADLVLLAKPGIVGVVLPKAERPEDLLAASRGAHGLPVLALIESALGFEHCRALARTANVERLIFGTIDFMADMNMRCSEDELLPFRTELVLASRLAGIAPPIDGVCTAIDDIELLENEGRRARRLGFGGKLCIHPRQVPVVNRCFTPSADEVAWAHSVIEADARSGGAAATVEGKMVDRPVVIRAMSILREARARQR